MLAFSIALLLDMPRPYWAMASVYITSNQLTGATHSKAVYRILGTLIGAAGTIILVPNLVNAPELLSLAIALWVGICPLSFADRRHAAQLRVHAGRLHRGAARVSDRFDAPGGFRHRRRPRAGNHARNHLRECRRDARAAPERRLCGHRASGCLARRCTPAWHGCSDRPWQRSGARQRRIRLAAAAPKSTSSGGISATRPPRSTNIARGLQRLRQHMLSLLPLLGSIEDRKLALDSDGAASARWPKSAQGPRDGSKRAVAMDRKPMRCARRLTNPADAGRGCRLDRHHGRRPRCPAARSCRCHAGLPASARGDRRWPRSGPLKLAFNSDTLTVAVPHRDHGLALCGRVGVALSVLACCAFWIVTGWTDGASAALFAALVGTFLAGAGRSAFRHSAPSAG